MIRFGRRVCGVLIWLPLLSGAANAQMLIRGRTPVATIYYTHPAGPVSSASPLLLAVQELNYHLIKMSGASLKVVSVPDAAQVRGPAIILGDIATRLGAVPRKTSASKEGFRLLTRGDRLLIGGESDQAVLFGVYEVLRKLGCEWVMPGEIGEIIPHRDTVVLPTLDESQAPDFLVRRLHYRGGRKLNTPADYARMRQWLLRQDGGDYDLPQLHAGGHYWNEFIRRHQAEFDRDPTMYALVRAPDGALTRRGPQIESTHPRVAELMAADIRDAFVSKEWTKDRLAAFPIGPADGLGFSVSAESALAGGGRIDPITGSPDMTDLVVLLANKVLEQLGSEYPNVYVGYYSYFNYADYPARYVPNPRVVPIFAPISVSRLHSILDANSKSQAYYRGVVEKWGALARQQGNVLLYRGYDWNLSDNMLPYSKAAIWGAELPFYRKMGVLGLNVEATKAWGVNGPSDWIFMRLAWDSSQDWQTLLKRYCDKSFGAGAEAMRRYFMRLIERQRDGGQEAGSYNAFHLLYDAAFVTAGRADMAEAERLAQSGPEKTRIGYFANGLTELDLYLKYFAAAGRYDFPLAGQQLKAMSALWQAGYDANPDTVAKEAPAYLDRFLGRFVEQAAKYSGTPYGIVAPLPDEMATIFDPYGSGQRMNYQGPQVDDSRFVKTKTWSVPWDAQGLGGLRSGAVWYRWHFRLPAGRHGQGVGLFLGGFADEARVWINGKWIGTSGKAAYRPATFDLTDGVTAGGDNLLAVEIVRNDPTSELGMGGLYRPSFLFSGPRLTAVAPSPLRYDQVFLPADAAP